MMDTVLGPKYRGKGVLKFILSKAVSQLTSTLGLRVKTVASDKPYFVKDTFYVINALVRLVRHALLTTESLSSEELVASDPIHLS